MTKKVKTLIEKLGDEDSDVRCHAIEALGKIGRGKRQKLPVKHAVKPLIKMVEDDDLTTYAAEALGLIGDKRAVKPLIKVLGEDVYENSGGEYEDSEVRSSAAYALGRISDKRAVKPLIKLLNDEDFVVVTAAAYALGWIGDKRAVRPLADTIEYACNNLCDGDTAIVAAEAVANIGDDSGVNQLLGALQVLGEGGPVEFAIIEALKKLGCELTWIPEE